MTRRASWRPVSVVIRHGFRHEHPTFRAAYQTADRTETWGDALDAVPGLAVTPEWVRGAFSTTVFRITHIKSGLAVPRLSGSRAAMRRLLRVLGRGLNWDRAYTVVCRDKDIRARYASLAQKAAA